MSFVCLTPAGGSSSGEYVIYPVAVREYARKVCGPYALLYAYATPTRLPCIALVDTKAGNIKILEVQNKKISVLPGTLV